VRIVDSEPEEAEVICLIIARLGLKDTNKRLLFHTERLVDFLLGLLGGSSELGQQVCSMVRPVTVETLRDALAEFHSTGELDP
jgi:hypothetical protein